MRTFVRALELAARHAIVYPVLRLFLHNPSVRVPLDIGKLRKILILRYDRIGDIVVTMPIFRILKKANPNIVVGVVASPSNAELILHNPHVDHIYILHSQWIPLAREIRAANREHYDLVLNFIFNRTTSGGILANIIAPRSTKIGQGAEKYRFYFNVLLKLSRGSKHMVEVLGDIVAEVFGITVTPKDLRLVVSTDPDSEKRVEEYLVSKKLRHRQKRDRGRKTYVVVNLSATDEVRKLSEKQAELILRILAEERKCRTVVIAAPPDQEWRDRAVRTVRGNRCWTYPDSGIAGLRDIAAIIRGASAVVTPDTAVIHLASAAKTPVFGLFTSLQIVAEWLPFKVKHANVFAGNGMPVSSIGEKTLRTQLNTFLNTMVRE